MLDREFDDDPVLLRTVIERFGIQFGFPLVQRLRKIGNTALVTISHGVRLHRAFEIELNILVVIVLIFVL